MSRDEFAARSLLFKLLDFSVDWTKFASWMKNLKYTVKNSHLLDEDELSQATFASYFISLIESKGRLIKSLAMQCTDSQYQESEAPTRSGAPDFQYMHDFPCLGESSSSKLSKSKRRITPTTILNKGGRLEKMNSSTHSSLQLTKVQEDKYANLFSSQRGKKYIQNADPYSQNIKKRVFQDIFADMNATEKEELDIMISIYNLILEGTHVPSITTHIQFLLGIFNAISQISGNVAITNIRAPPSYMKLLNSVIHWKYFCIGIFMKQQNLLLKTDYIVRHFLSTKLSQMNHSDSRVKRFSENLNYISDGFMMCCDMSHTKAFDEKWSNDIELTNKDDLAIFSEIEVNFKEEEERWNGFSENTEISAKLKDLLKNNSDVFISYKFGQLFVESLLISDKESVHNRGAGDHKLVQLKSRLMKPLTERDNEKNFTFKELFYKNIIDFCFSECRRYIRYIKYAILSKINELSQDKIKAYVNNLSRCMKYSILMDLRTKLSLSKLMGYIDFYDDQISMKASEAEKDLLWHIRSEIMPLTDIKDILLVSIKSGCLTVTVPWIVQYLCMADKLCASALYYHDIIFILFSLYVSQLHFANKEERKFFANCELKHIRMVKLAIIIPRRASNTDVTNYSEGTNIPMTEEGVLFVKLWLGKLFESQMFSENLFYRLFQFYIEKLGFIKYKGGPYTWKPCIDCTDLISQEAFSIHCNFFCKMKYWEDCNPLIKNIRPVLLEDENAHKPPDTYEELEKLFFHDYPDMHQIIKFVIDRISTIFETEISDIIKKKSSSSPDMGKNDIKLLFENIEVIKSHCEEKACEAIEALSCSEENDIVIKTSIHVCKINLRQIFDDFLRSKGVDMDMLDAHLSALNLEEDSAQIAVNNLSLDNNEEYLTKALCRLAVLLDTMVNAPLKHSPRDVLKEFQLIRDKFERTNYPKMRKTFLRLTWNYVLHLSVTLPHLINTEFVQDVCSFWRFYGGESNEIRMLTPRIITPAAKKKHFTQYLIAKKFALLVYYCLKIGLLSPGSFECDCVAVFQHNWNKRELKFIKSTISNILDHLADIETVGFNALINMLECLGETANNIEES